MNTAAINAREHLDEYRDDLTLIEARQVYFDKNRLGDGGYTSRWAKITVFGLSYWMPNPKARRAALPYHDLNHVLTGYPPTTAGESILAGFEVGSGIGPYWLGWLISSQAMALGILFVPRAVFRAWVRGRRSGSTYKLALDADMLARPLGEVRQGLGIPEPSSELRATPADVLRFVAHVVATLVLHALPVAALIALLSR